MQEEKFNKQDGNLDQPIVNESLALAGLFRKVSVKDRLPKDGKGHYYILKDGSFGDKPKFSIHKEQIKIINRTCEYWLEEVELPTQKQIVTERKNRSYQTFQFDLGAYWVMDVLAGKAATAKDNVR